MTQACRLSHASSAACIRNRSCLLLAAGIAALLVAGCTTPTQTRPSVAAVGASTAPAAAGSPQPHAPIVAPGETGIPACDDYLASYKQCHRAAGIYAPDTIDAHYRSMHQALLEQARDPDRRSALAARCIALATLLKQSLRGKPCTPTQADSTP